MLHRTIHRLATFAVAATLLLGLPATLPAEEKAATGHGQAAFDKLKSLEGTWKDIDSTEDEPQMHVFELSSAGTVVQETMAPGTDHEMINMYHLNGDDLMLTHYCAGGTQPRMKLVSTDASKGLTFEFMDGTNFDPAVDGHIHRGNIVFVGDDSIEATWVGYNEGKEAGSMTFKLTRVSD